MKINITKNILIKAVMLSKPQLAYAEAIAEITCFQQSPTNTAYISPTLAAPTAVNFTLRTNILELKQISRLRPEKKTVKL